jgi:protein-disulfide isomerase
VRKSVGKSVGKSVPKTVRKSAREKTPEETRERGRENALRAIGGLAQRLASGIAQRRGKTGVSIGRLRAEWSAIAGPDLARICRPEALLAARGRSGKALRLRVPGAAALEVQHRSAQLVERVNAYFGHRTIDDIRLVQGAVAAPDASPAPPAPDTETVRRMSVRAAAVEDPDLRAALARLGASIASRRKALVGLLGAPLLARPLRAQDLPREKLLDVLPTDHVLGKADAPNVLIDYASFTCPHCATFFVAVFPVLRQQWIDTGKLRFVLRHFPSDQIATHAAQLAECAGSDKFFERTVLLFRKQVEWLTGDDPMQELVKVLTSDGLDAERAKACLADDQHLDKVIADVQSGQTLGVHYTPTLFINDEFYGNPPGGFDAIAAILRQVGR